MAAGDITSTITECATPAAIKTYLDSEGTGAATVGTSTTDFQVVQVNNGTFLVIKIARAAA